MLPLKEIARPEGMFQASQGPSPGAGMWLSHSMPSFPCLKVGCDSQGGTEFWDRVDFGNVFQGKGSSLAPFVFNL